MEKKKSLLNRIWFYVVLGGKHLSYYKEHKEPIKQTNYKALLKISILTSILCFILFSVCLVLDLVWGYFSNLWIWYLSATFCSALILIICITCRSKWKTILFEIVKYAFIIGMYTFAILLRFISNQGIFALEIYVFFAIIPLIFFDRPYRIFLISILFLAAFLVSGFFYTRTESNCLISPDIDYMVLVLNSVSYFIIGEFLMVALQRMRIRALDRFDIVKKERDTDDLTTLANRRFFNAAFARMNDTSALSGIIMLDIDLFKLYNDIYGHLAGDDALNRIGTTLLSIAKENSISAFRYGGEEFVFLVFSHTEKQIRAICSEIVTKIYNLNIESRSSKTGILTVSVGYSINHGNKIEKYRLLKMADNALYGSKTRGGNTFSRASK